METDFFDESSDTVKNNQDNNLNDDKLKNGTSNIFNQNLVLGKELSIKKHVDDEVDKKTIVGFNQTFEKCIKVSVGIDVYNLTNYDKIQITDTTEFKFPNLWSNLLQ